MLCAEHDGRLSPRAGRWEVYGSAEGKEEMLGANGGGSGIGGGEPGGDAAETAVNDPLLRGAGEASDAEGLEAHV